jgi:hypothetical protein
VAKPIVLCRLDELLRAVHRRVKYD